MPIDKKVTNDPIDLYESLPPQSNGNDLKRITYLRFRIFDPNEKPTTRSSDHSPEQAKYGSL